jgi:hypothetical protein
MYVMCAVLRRIHHKNAKPDRFLKSNADMNHNLKHARDGGSIHPFLKGLSSMLLLDSVPPCLKS